MIVYPGRLFARSSAAHPSTRALRPAQFIFQRVTLRLLAEVAHLLGPPPRVAAFALGGLGLLVRGFRVGWRAHAAERRFQLAGRADLYWLTGPDVRRPRRPAVRRDGALRRRARLREQREQFGTEVQILAKHVHGLVRREHLVHGNL